MKKLLVLCLFAASLSVIAAGQKIATVDLGEVIKSHPKTEGNTKLLLDTKQSYDKQCDDLRAKAKEVYDAYMAANGRANDASMKEANRKKAQDEAKELLAKLQTADEALQKKIADLQRSLAEQELNLFQGIMGDVQEKLIKITDAREIDLVLDKSAERNGAPTAIVLFSAASLDITADLIKLCNPPPKE